MFQINADVFDIHKQIVLERFMFQPIVFQHALEASPSRLENVSKAALSLYKCFYKAKVLFYSSTGNILNLSMDLSNQHLVKFTNRDRILNVLPCVVRHIHQNPWLAGKARFWKAVSVCGWATGDGRGRMRLLVIQCPVYVEPQCSLPEGSRTIRIWWPCHLDLSKHVHVHSYEYGTQCMR